MNRRSVLISQPGSQDHLPFLPYVWALLKTHCERQADVSEHVDWLPPIYQHTDASSLVEPYDGGPIDVLGLSCYTWNWDLQCRIAQQIKARNRECVVVAGGPEPDYKDPDFFRKYPYIDVIVVRDGEITFTEILKKLVAGDSDLTDVGGLYLPSPSGGAHVFTGPAIVPTVFDYSPYIEQRKFLEEAFAHDGDQPRFNASLETNRGCPYRCSFCDWGSATMTKVRPFDLERVRSELEWLAKMRVGLMYLADANFGILQRDLEIADFVTTVYQKYGYPAYFAYNVAKNNPARSVAISKKLCQAGVTLKHELSIQHTDLEVLAATDRANISPDKQVEVVRQLIDAGVPIDVQLIRGLPGDTYEKSKACLANLMEWGIHATYTVYPYQLLPNAPAAEPDYMETWKISTIARRTSPIGDGSWRPVDLSRLPVGNFIVESKTFSRSDWVAMSAYSAFVRTLHNASLTRLVAMYLRFTHGVPYQEFYEGVVEEFCASTELTASWQREISSHYRNYLANEDAVDFMPVKEIPDYDPWLEPPRWLLVQLCMKHGAFFDSLAAFLLDRYPDAENLASAIDYQRNLVILPSYERSAGKTFPISRDWQTYFARASRLTTVEPLPEPAPTRGSVLEVNDTTCTDDARTYPLDWESLPEGERWPVWIARIVVGHTGSSERRCNFQRLRIRPANTVA